MGSEVRFGRGGLLVGALLAFGCSGSGNHATASAGAGAGEPAAGNAGASAAGMGGTSASGESGAAGDSGASGAPSGDAGNGGAALANTAGSGGVGGSIPASAAMPCGAACDAAGFQCIADECHAGEGALLWQHRLNERYADQVGDIASDSNGNAIVGFATQIRSPFLADRLFVRKFDEDGGQIWEHAFLGDQYGVLTAIAVDAQDRIYVGGGLGYGGETAFVRVLDADGKLLKQIDWKAADLRLVDHLAFDPSGNLLVSGTTGVAPARPVVVKKLDPSGNELWSKTYHDGGLNYAGFQVAATATGNVLLGTSTNTMPAAAFIGAYDPSGTSLWSDTYSAVGKYSASMGILEWDNGEVLAIGRQDTVNWLRRYSAEGGLLKSSDVSSDGRSLTSLVGRAGALYVGGGMDTQGHPLQAWISKVTNDGQPAGWQFADTLDAFVYGRDVEHLAVTPQGDVLALGGFDWHSDYSVWLARFAGPKGGVPRVDVSSLPQLITNTYPDHDDSAIFADKAVPECDAQNSYQLAGTLGGAPLTYQDLTTSDFLPTSFEMLTSAMLRWKDYVQEGTAMPLIGDHLILPAGQPHAGETLCITGGDVGVLPATYNPNPGRQLKFRIAAGSLGADCKGTSIAVDIKGCFYRFTDYLP